MAEDGATAGNDAATKFFEALNDNSDALIDAVRAANNRAHRISTAMIEQAQEGQRDAVEMGKKWLAAPFDFLGLYSALMESATKSQGRALDATRQMFGELSDAQKETRDVLQRMVTANRAAGEATVDVARGLFSRASEAVQSARSGNGRKGAREATQSAEAATDES